MSPSGMPIGRTGFQISISPILDGVHAIICLLSLTLLTWHQCQHNDSVTRNIRVYMHIVANVRALTRSMWDQLGFFFKVQKCS